MRRTLVCFLAIFFFVTAGMSWAADPAAGAKTCPFTGTMPDYEANGDGKPSWQHWDSFTFRIIEGAEQKNVVAHGAVCTQIFGEMKGKTEGSSLEIVENYKESLLQQGFEVKYEHDGEAIFHRAKDDGENWIRVNSSRDDSYGIVEVVVTPFQRTLLPPSGNDYRLLGHMPGFVAGNPNKKHYDEFSFLLEHDRAAVRGALYDVGYDAPQHPAGGEITGAEIIENYRLALVDLNAEFLRVADELTARLDDHGQVVWVYVTPRRVVAVEEKPFQFSLQPPKADEMKDKLDKEGHIALYVNFDFNKATLKPDAAPIIAQVVQLLKDNPDLKLSIDGHTDSIGTHDYNVKLSGDRAASVVAAIVAGGIDAGRLKSAGYGPDKPIAPNDTEENRAKNRRVELVKAS